MVGSRTAEHRTSWRSIPPFSRTIEFYGDRFTTEEIEGGRTRYSWVYKGNRLELATAQPFLRRSGPVQELGLQSGTCQLDLIADRFNRAVAMRIDGDACLEVIRRPELWREQSKWY